MSGIGRRLSLCPGLWWCAGVCVSDAESDTRGRTTETEKSVYARVATIRSVLLLGLPHFLGATLGCSYRPP
jgi:hypothetical protein